ncbi:S8 family serine peptidase [Lachnospiraceae bacterium 38-10]
MKKRFFAVTTVVLLFTAGGFLFWFLTGGFWARPVTGQISDEAYREGRKTFYRREKYRPWDRGVLSGLPEQDVNMGFDIRSYDVSGFDLQDKGDILSTVTFDTDTVWPEKLPEGFLPDQILETGKDPGLGIRALHEQGITGKGVSIAIVDQALNLEHTEYADNLMSYELLHCCDDGAQMHGSAVTSIAVGKSCGVAPDADVYYIASTFGRYGAGGMKINLRYMADSIDRILEINTYLPEEKKIRVISISRGFRSEKGSDAVRAAIERAKDAGVFVVTTSTEDNYGFALMGLGKELMTDPSDISSYGPGHFWSDSFYGGYTPDAAHMLLVPMDGRTYASWNDTAGYEFSASGGLSWSVPWMAGLYALCLQTDEDLTPEVFIQKAFETGTVKTVEYQGRTYELGTIIDPAALIEELK